MTRFSQWFDAFCCRLVGHYYVSGWCKDCGELDTAVVLQAILPLMQKYKEFQVRIAEAVIPAMLRMQEAVASFGTSMSDYGKHYDKRTRTASKSR